MRKLFLIAILFFITSGFSSFYSSFLPNKDGDNAGVYDAKSISQGDNYLLSQSALSIFTNVSMLQTINKKTISVGMPLTNVFEQRTNTTKAVYASVSNSYLELPQVALAMPFTAGLKSSIRFDAAAGIAKIKDYSYKYNADILNSSGNMWGHTNFDYSGGIYALALGSNVGYVPMNVNGGVNINILYGRKSYSEKEIYNNYDITKETNTFYTYKGSGFGLGLDMALAYKYNDMLLTTVYSTPYSITFKGEEDNDTSQTGIGSDTPGNTPAYTKNIKYTYPGKLGFGIKMKFNDDYNTQMYVSLIRRFYGSQYKYNDSKEVLYRSINELHLGFSHIINNLPIRYGMYMLPTYLESNRISTLFLTAGSGFKVRGFPVDVSIRWGSRYFKDNRDALTGDRDKITEHILDLAISTNFNF